MFQAATLAAVLHVSPEATTTAALPGSNSRNFSAQNISEFLLPPTINNCKEWGDSIDADPQNLHRIYFQNVDGIRNDSDEIAMYVASMAQFNVHTFCWADPGIRRLLLLTMSINGNFFVVSDLYMSQTKHLFSFDNLNIVLFYCLIVSLNNICSLITTLNVEL